MIKTVGSNFPSCSIEACKGKTKGKTDKAKPETLDNQGFPVAGEEGFEPSAYGFGDRRSAN